jgi:hypothetical protein
MTFKSLFSFRKPGGHAGSDASMIVFLMMALVFVPILAAHVAVQWHDQIGQAGARHLAAAVNMLVSMF